MSPACKALSGARAAASSLASVASSALAAGRAGSLAPTDSSTSTACSTACALAAASGISRRAAGPATLALARLLQHTPASRISRCTAAPRDHRACTLPQHRLPCSREAREVCGRQVLRAWRQARSVPSRRWSPGRSKRRRPGHQARASVRPPWRTAQAAAGHRAARHPSQRAPCRPARMTACSVTAARGLKHGHGPSAQQHARARSDYAGRSGVALDCPHTRAHTPLIRSQARDGLC